ncbi:MAG TPA: N-6 DNA methylase, partial [Planctomycetia bacterium]|nr:N-6 DNA methylase [Planctomycetia bacterium]
MSSLAPRPFADYWRPLGDSAARKVLQSALEFARNCRALIVACTGRRLADLPWRDPARALPLDWLDDLAGEPTEPLADDLVIDLAVDPVRISYERLIPAAVRKRNGEFHTPSFLADRLVARLSPAAGQGGDDACFDPCVGGGAFLLALARAGLPMESTFGIDSNPWALLGAAANAARAERARLRRPVSEFQIPVAFADLLATENPGWPQFDVLLGNPPWLNWDKLAPANRERLAPHWRRYGLFAESRMSAILGGGKKELAGLVILTALDRFLKPGGRAGFVIPMSLLTARGAGRGFRRFALPDGEPLAALALEDWRATQPFAEAAVHAGLLWLHRGKPTSYPVPVAIIESKHQEMAASAAPSESDDPLSAWAIGADADRVSLAPLSGKSAYQARLGVNTGGANGL